MSAKNKTTRLLQFLKKSSFPSGKTSAFFKELDEIEALPGPPMDPDEIRSSRKNIRKLFGIVSVFYQTKCVNLQALIYFYGERREIQAVEAANRITGGR